MRKSLCGVLAFVVTSSCTSSPPEPPSEDTPTPAISPFEPVRLSDDVQEFFTEVPQTIAPVLLNVEICSPSGKNCLIPETTELCGLEGQAEIIFFSTKEYGFVALGDGPEYHPIKLERTRGELGKTSQFETDEGRLVATLTVTSSELSRGRARGPGLVGELSVELDGKPIGYPYPSPPRNVIIAPFDCWQDGELTR